MSYACNLKNLKDNFPQIHEKILSVNPAQDCRIIIAKNKMPSALITGTSGQHYLHSTYNPAEEAKRFINRFCLRQGDIPVVLGFGLGYHCLELAKASGILTNIIILEARPDIFVTAMHAMDLTPILTNRKITFIFEQDHQKLLKHLYTLAKEQNLKDRLRLIIHQPSLDLYKTAGSDLTDIIERIQIGPKVQELLRKNFISNLECAVKTCGIKNFFGAFPSTPIFLVCAGPSLTANLKLLRNIKDRGLIICASTIFSLLLKNDIKPDFVAIGDPKPIMLTHFTGCLRNTTPLIFLPTACAEVIKRYQGAKIVALQNDFSYSDVVAKNLDKGRVDVGESVATLMLDVAIRMSGNPIIFVGQDLAFSDGHTHAHGVSKRLKIALSSRKVNNTKGKAVATSSVYLRILHWMEKRIQHAKNTSFINTSLDGAHIPGTTPMPLEQAIAQYCTKQIDKERIKNLLSTT